MKPLRWPRNASLAGGGHQAPDVEVSAALLERRGREQDIHQPPRVGLELPALRRGVAVAEQQEIHLHRGVAVLLQCDDAARIRRRRGGVHEHALRIDRRRPDVLPGVGGAALADGESHRRGRGGEANRLVKRAAGRLRFFRGHPFVEHRSEPGRVDDLLRRGVAHVEAVGAVAERVLAGPGRPRPGRRLDRNFVEGKDFR